VGGLLLVWSIAFNGLVSLQHNQLLRINHPRQYERLARIGNQVAHTIEGGRGLRPEYGPIELELIFPPEVDSGAEALLATGTSFLSDYIYVLYARNFVRIGFEHTSYGGFTTPPVRVVPNRTYRLRLELGSLYPPVEHPYYDGMNGHQVRLRRHMLRMTLDEQVLLQRVADFYDPTDYVPSLGTAAGRPGFTRPFSGTIVSSRRLPEEAPVAEADPTGPVRLELTLPPFSVRRTEPLLSTGVAGSADLVYITYLSGNRITIGHDHWGAGGAESEPVPVAPGEVLIIEIDSPALYRDPTAVAERPLLVLVNGREVLRGRELVHPAPADSVVIGRNTVGFSTAADVFTGRIQWVSRLAEPLPLLPEP
jgi:hypothetical protein